MLEQARLEQVREEQVPAEVRALAQQLQCFCLHPKKAQDKRASESSECG